MLETDFLELLAKQCGYEVKQAADTTPELPCPLGLYRCMCALPFCQAMTATYGRKLLTYEWRAHLKAVHLEDSRALLNLMEEMEHEALKQWEAQPAAVRTYVQAVVSVPPLVMHKKEAPQASQAAAGAPQHASEAPPTTSQETANQPTSESATTTRPTQATQLLSPSLCCPFMCGCEHLVPGSDYGKHAVSHLPELQVLTSVLDILVLRAYNRNCCPFEDFAAIGQPGMPGPCRHATPKDGDWWAHLHCEHMTDALATTMHLFRRGERTLEAAANAAKSKRTSLQLLCPMPQCQSHTPTAVKLVGHLVGHLRSLHPDNDMAHLLCVRAKDIQSAGAAGAAASRQPFLTGRAAGKSAVAAGGHGHAVKGSKGYGQSHTVMSYSVIRGGEEVGPHYLKHNGKGQLVQDQQEHQQQQQQVQQQPTQKRPPQKQQHLPQQQLRQHHGQQQQQLGVKGTQAAKQQQHLMHCPFPGCCTAPGDQPSLDQPVQDLQLPTYTNPHCRTMSFASEEELEAHVFASHSAELVLAAQQFTCTARKDVRNGLLLCPVRVAPVPPYAPECISKSAARRQVAERVGRRQSTHSKMEAVPQLGEDFSQNGDGHHAYHAHAKDLVQHVHAQHTPLTMVVAALAKGLVIMASGNQGQTGRERCPLCPQSAAAAQLLDALPVFSHLLEHHPSQLLQVYHCLQTLTSKHGSGSSATQICLLGCGASNLEGGKLGAMLHTAEEHALEVVELAAASAAEALPSTTTTWRSKEAVRRPAGVQQFPSTKYAKLLALAAGNDCRGANQPFLAACEQLSTQSQGVQAARVHPSELLREHLRQSYGPPQKPGPPRTTEPVQKGFGSMAVVYPYWRDVATMADMAMQGPASETTIPAAAAAASVPIMSNLTKQHLGLSQVPPQHTVVIPKYPPIFLQQQHPSLQQQDRLAEVDNPPITLVERLQQKQQQQQQKQQEQEQLQQKQQQSVSFPKPVLHLELQPCEPDVVRVAFPSPALNQPGKQEEKVQSQLQHQPQAPTSSPALVPSALGMQGSSTSVPAEPKDGQPQTQTSNSSKPAHKPGGLIKAHITKKEADSEEFKDEEVIDVEYDSDFMD